MNKIIEVYTLKATAWCANDIMYLYAKNTPGVSFERNKYMQGRLTIEGKKYKCQSWSITPDKDNEDYDKVRIHLKEIT